MNQLEQEHIKRVTTMEWKCVSIDSDENHFWLKNKKVQIHAKLSKNKMFLEIEVETVLLSSQSSYYFKNPLTVKDLLLAQRDAMKNFHTTVKTEQSRTWKKYRNPSRKDLK